MVIGSKQDCFDSCIVMSRWPRDNKNVLDSVFNVISLLADVPSGVRTGIDFMPIQGMVLKGFHCFQEAFHMDNTNRVDHHIE